MATIEIRYPDDKATLLADLIDEVFPGRDTGLYTKIEWAQLSIESELEAKFRSAWRCSQVAESVGFGSEV